MAVNLTAIAAFTAAGLSLVNIVLSARLTRHHHLEQWRRDEERPVVARLLTLSQTAMQRVREMGYARIESSTRAGETTGEPFPLTAPRVPLTFPPHPHS